MFRGVDVFEAPWARGEEGSGFLGDVCGMIVENEANNRFWRIVGVDVLEQFNKLDTAVPILYSPEER